MNFKDYLTDEERLQCIKFGIMRKTASCGKTPKDIGLDGMIKSSGVLDVLGKAYGVTSGAVSGTLTNAIALSVLAGVPVGAMLHYLDRSMKKDSKKTERLIATRDTYNNVMNAMKSRLMNPEEFA
jgi:hypothetical protein